MSPADDDGAIARLLVLKALPLFADVPPDELAVVAERTAIRTFAAGDAIAGGDGLPVTAIHLVLEGRVTEHRGGRAFRTYGPRHVVGGVDALAAPDVGAGAACPIAGVHAVADEDTRTLAIDRAVLREILEDNFGILAAALQGVAASTLRLRRRLPAAGFAPAEAATRDGVPADDLASRIAFLRDATWLGRMRVRTLGQLALEGTLRVARDGERLWRAGDVVQDGAVVLRGRIACTAAPANGSPFVVGRGTVLGLEEALALEERAQDAEARGETSVLSITRASLLDALEDDPDTAFSLLEAMATIAVALRDRLAGLAPGGDA